MHTFEFGKPCGLIVVASNIFVSLLYSQVRPIRSKKMGKKKYTFDIGNNRLLTIAKKYDLYEVWYADEECVS